MRVVVPLAVVPGDVGRVLSPRAWAYPLSPPRGSQRQGGDEVFCGSHVNLGVQEPRSGVSRDAACHSIRTATPSTHSYTGLAVARVPRHRRGVRHSSSHTTTHRPAHSGDRGSGSAAVGVAVGQTTTWVAPLRCGDHDHHVPCLGVYRINCAPVRGRKACSSISACRSVSISITRSSISRTSFIKARNSAKASAPDCPLSRVGERPRKNPSHDATVFDAPPTLDAAGHHHKLSQSQRWQQESPPCPTTPSRFNVRGETKARGDELHLRRWVRGDYPGASTDHDWPRMATAPPAER